MFFTPQKVNRIVPSALIALITGTLVSLYFGFNVDIIGEIKTQLPSLTLPSFTLDEFSSYIPLAF